MSSSFDNGVAIKSDPTEATKLLPGSLAAQHEAARSHRHKRLAQACILSCAALWFFGGVLYLWTVEGFTLIRAIYVCIEVVTTIGYGDFTVKRHGELFFCVYIVGCVLLVSFAMSSIMDHVLAAQTNSFKMEMCALENKLGVVSSKTKPTSVSGNINDIAAAALVCAVFLVFGTVFFHNIEKCTCMRNGSPIQGCIEDSCSSTGGIELEATSALYMSIVTLTTVGFGDRHPNTEFGMLAACGWMLLGVGATANFVRAFSLYFFGKLQQRSYIYDQKISKDVFDKMDLHHDGTITKGEYRRFMLLKFKLVDEDILDVIDHQFDALNKKGSHKLTFDDIAALYHDEALEGKLL